jgi:putative ABC transport system permease protein
MRHADLLHFARSALWGAPLRSALSVLAMAIGVAAVILLTALGDSARRYVIHQFASMGSNLIMVMPGRSETGGFSPATVITRTPRDLTIDDAHALLRAPAVRLAAPLLVGTSEAHGNGRMRPVMVAGTVAEMMSIRHYRLAEGHFLPQGDWQRAPPVAVLGAKVHSELFANSPLPALGQWIQIGDRRLRIIGILAASGQGMGMNTDELVMVPVPLAQSLFNTYSLFRILVEARSRADIPAAKGQIAEILKTRHRGEKDVTLVSQDAILGTFDRIFRILTFSVAGIAAISLAVAGILVMNVMLVAVSQRSSEIGLLKALGATRQQIRNAFLVEAILLSSLGALFGLVLGYGGAWAIRTALPTFPVWPPDWAVIAGLSTALSTGILFGIQPARRAARLNPVDALMRHA